MGYLLPWGQMSYWGAQVIVNLFAGDALHRPRPGAADPRRLRRRRRDAEPLLQLPRDRGAAGAARPGRRRTSSRCTRSARTTPTASRSRPSKDARRPCRSTASRSIRTTRCTTSSASCVFLIDLQRDRVLRARGRRLLPRVQQLHPGRPAEDAGAHRAGLVLHAVLLDAARDHRPDGLRADRRCVPLAAVLGHPARAASAGDARSAIAGRRASSPVALLQTFDAKFWGVVVMGGAVDHPVLPALARPQPGASRSATARAGTSTCTACSSSSSWCSATSARSRRRPVGKYVSQIGTLFYFGFFLLMPWWSRIGDLQAGARARDLRRPLTDSAAQR